MRLEFRKLHPTFVAEASRIDLRKVEDEGALEGIREAMDRFAVLVFRDQALSGEEQLAFAIRLDGELHRKTGISVLQKSRFGDEALTDVSNVGADGKILDADARQRSYTLANRLWHTDASFQDPRGRYSMLAALVVPPVPADTQFADMRAAHDSLPETMRAGLEGLRVHHSIAYSRQTLGLSSRSGKRLPQCRPPWCGQPRPSTAPLPRSMFSVVERPIQRALLSGTYRTRDAPERVYRHSWRAGDVVIWDNRATMHRACPFDDTIYRREMRRVTTLDVGDPSRMAQAA